MLVHICCAVDSHYFLQKLQKEYPNEKLIGFFYDPNIHPYSEYYLRFLEVKRSCNILNIELIEGEYDFNNWLNAIRGLENEPEKGKRCNICFDNRFEVSAKKSVELKQKSFTSTLLTSPKKSLNQLKSSGEELGKKYNIKFIAPDYRKSSGTQEQNILAKEAKLYRQNYCGCLFALNKQREEQKKVNYELFSPISNQIQPNSIEEKIELYKKRIELEKRDIEYEIIKEKFLNWRLFFGVVKSKEKIILSHFLPYSTLKRGYTKGKIAFLKNDVYFFNRLEISLITLKTYNQKLKTNYKNIEELIKNPPPFEKEIKIRENPYDLSTLIVVDEIPSTNIEIVCKSEIFEDTRDSLVENSNFNSKK